ncbi:Mn(2+) transporter [Haloferula helveola]|uniref:Mn(2+) transporter n=1 Tax=Haloferula helveola TaxID=490095 RepID=A0ABM7R857_9BACT|nr:Mn(2+) transporter [Haloferula helveola]
MKTHESSDLADPPKTLWGILKQLGPGLIIAGSIVGSGELIATTAVGAEAGFLLLWLIIIGCLIKVFVQIEFGRYAITSGRTTLDGLNEVPGPRLRVNWLCWFWLVFIVVALIQLGGIIGGVGQALAIQQPLTESGEVVNAREDAVIQIKVADSIADRFGEDEAMAPVMEKLAVEKADAQKVLSGFEGKEQVVSHDSMLWASLVTIVSIVLLVIGRYRLIQNVSTALVASFTLVTIINLFYLQALPEWRVSWADLVDGMSFRIPEGKGLTVALAAFGIIGVGATELIQYPYWCLEKGYAKWTGPRDDSPEWAERAKGWVRVLRWDAWCSMVVYTFATVAFYLLGAAILGRTGLDPSGDQMVRTLGQMYVPVFGSAAQAVFLFGAFAVLYSTFFVATASHARVCADALRVFGVSKGGEASYRAWVRGFCIGLPLLFLASYAFFKAPKELVLAGGFMGALMLPMLGAAALYFRYRRCDERLTPSRVWDVGLWISCAGLLVAGVYAFYTKMVEMMGGYGFSRAVSDRG